MRVLAKVVDLEDGHDKDGKSICHVTMKFVGERRAVVVALKEPHLQAGVHRVLDGLISKPILINLGTMVSEEKDIIWYFPGMNGGGPNPVLYVPSAADSIASKSIVPEFPQMGSGAKPVASAAPAPVAR
jgi:hypothetical protein